MDEFLMKAVLCNPVADALGALHEKAHALIVRRCKTLEGGDFQISPDQLTRALIGVIDLAGEKMLVIRNSIATEAARLRHLSEPALDDSYRAVNEPAPTEADRLVAVHPAITAMLGRP